ncbi:MAG: MmcQ/YjbR family DNA-binding protein [Thermoanaerobaculia bacterium]
MKEAAPPRHFRLDLRRVPAGARRLRERARGRCLKLEGAVEEFPWGGAGVYKVRGKIFASTDVNGSVYEIAFKPPPEEREDALALPFVRVADYVGRYGWVQASLTKVGQLELIWPWIVEAHRRLAPKGKLKRTTR